MSEKLLEVKNLRVSYHTYAGEVQSVRGVSFTVNKGETVAVVGESGCGKSVTAKSIMRLIKTPPAEIKEGSEIIFDGEDVLQFNEKRLCAYRGGEVAMVFQDALAALNPTMTVGNQIIENLRHHTKLSKKKRPRPVPWSCCGWWGSPSRRAGWTSTRTSSRAECASA